MIGLRCADVISVSARCANASRHQKFQFARLVAAGREAGLIVTFDPERRAAQAGREVGQRMQRRREKAE